MFVIGSDNDEGPPDLTEDEAQALALLATASGTVVSILQQVPNQPLIFTNDPSPDNERREDELVAFTLDRATRTGDYNWAAYLPMVKSVVRAMDVVQSFVPTVTSPALDVSQFVVTGFSKRGATAWLTAAIDNRVIAVAPGVFDALNWAPSLENHRASYGMFSDALEDYLEFDILDRLRTPEGRELLQVIDPYAMRIATGSRCRNSSSTPPGMNFSHRIQRNFTWATWRAKPWSAIFPIPITAVKTAVLTRHC